VLRLGPILAILVLVGPVVAGLVGSLLPSFGYLPVLGGEVFSLDPWRAVFSAPGIWTSAAISLWTGLGTTLIAFSVVMLFVGAWHGTAMFRALHHLISPLLAVPHAAAAFGLAFLIAPSGWVMRALSPGLTGVERPLDLLIVNDPWGLAMMAGLVAKEIPFLLLVTLAALPQTDAGHKTRVTASFGYGRLGGWLKVVLPRLYPQIRLPIYAVIAYASSSVDVALILGPTTPPPLAVQLVKWMNDADLAMRFMASAGAILQLFVTLTALAIWRLCELVVTTAARPWLVAGGRSVGENVLRGAGAVMMSLSAAAIILGLACLAVWSFAGYWRFPDFLPQVMTAGNWMRHLPNAAGPVLTSVLVGLAATLIALALTLACLEREGRTGRTADIRALAILYVPLLVPQVAFLFGLQVLFLRLSLDRSAMAVILAHLVFVMPYVFLSLGDPWRSWDPRYGHLAAALGRGPAAIFWRVRLPMLLRPVLVAFAVGFAVSIGQYLPTLLVGGGRWPTITTEAVALASGADRRAIGVYALLQMGLPFVGFTLALVIPALAFRNRRLLKVTS